MCFNHANNPLKILNLKRPMYFNICEYIEKTRYFYSGMLGFK